MSDLISHRRFFTTSIAVMRSLSLVIVALVAPTVRSQLERTSPRTPRAVFFNDNVSVAWVPGAPVIDIAAVDPQRGPIFYTLEQKTDPGPRFTRNADCLRCHSNPQTVNVPGLLVRSFYT